MLGILRRRRSLIAGVTIFGTALICAVPALMPVQYAATSQVLIEPQSLMSDKSSVVEQSPDEAAVRTQIAALTSPRLLQRAIDRLNDDPNYLAAVAREAPPGLVARVWDDAMARLDRWMARSQPHRMA